MTLWAGSSGDPRQLAQAKTAATAASSLTARKTSGRDVILYLTAQGGAAAVSKSGGDNPAIAWLSVLGNTPPAKAVINEMTTVASVWTNAQFLDGTAIKGHPLGLRIAAGNVPNFVDLQTGGWGATIQDPLNSGQTPTMANFATLADLLVGLRHAGDGRCVQQTVRGGDGPEGQCAEGYAGGGAVDRALSLVPGREALRFAGRVLSGPEGQEPCERCHSCRT